MAGLREPLKGRTEMMEKSVRTEGQHSPSESFHRRLTKRQPIPPQLSLLPPRQTLDPTLMLHSITRTMHHGMYVAQQVEMRFDEEGALRDWRDEVDERGDGRGVGCEPGRLPGWWGWGGAMLRSTLG